MSIPEVSSRSRLIAFLKNFFAEKISSGYAAITGTPVDNQIATWTDSSTIEGSTYLTFDKSTGYLKMLNLSEQDCRFRIVVGGVSEGTTIDTQDAYSTTAAPLNLKPNGSVILQPKTSNKTTFFQVKDQGGTEFFTADSTNKIITVPYQPAFLAYLTADQTLTGGGTWDHVLFNAEAYDENNDFASSQFTAPKTGRYVFAASMRIDAIAAAATQWAQGKIKNTTTGRTYIIGLTDVDAGSDYETVVGAAVMDLEASDVVRVEAAVKSGAASHVYGQSSLNGDHRSYFSGYFLG